MAHQRCLAFPRPIQELNISARNPRCLHMFANYKPTWLTKWDTTSLIMDKSYPCWLVSPLHPPWHHHSITITSWAFCRKILMETLQPLVRIESANTHFSSMDDQDSQRKKGGAPWWLRSKYSLRNHIKLTKKIIRVIESSGSKCVFFIHFEITQNSRSPPGPTPRRCCPPKNRPREAKWHRAAPAMECSKRSS